jgi:hypothetical protein
VLYCAADAGTVIAVGDLLFLDTDDVKPAASFTWNTNLATTQAGFADVFIGVAMAAKSSGAAVTNFPVQISDDVTYTYDCDSETHEVSATMGVAKNPSSNALLSQKLVKAVAASSIARAQKRDSSASTSAVVRLQSAYWGHNAAGA